MALPGLKIKDKQKQRLRKERYNPLGSRYKNRLQFEQDVNRRTAGKVRPQLQALTQEGKSARSAHAGREADLKSMYDFQTNTVQDAYQKAMEAANKLVGMTAASTEGSQANLIGALERSQADRLAQANTVGGVLPVGDTDQTAIAAANAGDAMQAALADRSRIALAGAGDRIALTGLERTRDLTNEDERFRAIIEDIVGKKTDVKKNIGSVRSEVAKEIEDAELARAAEKGRQRIASQSLNLERRKTKEEERSNRAQEGIAWAQIDAQKEQFRAELAAATSPDQEKAIEERQRKYNAAVAIFSEYQQNTLPKNMNPGMLFKQIRLSGVSPQEAYRIMEAGAGPLRDWVAKRKGGKKKEYSGPPDPKTGKRSPYEK